MIDPKGFLLEIQEVQAPLGRVPHRVLVLARVGDQQAEPRPRPSAGYLNASSDARPEGDQRGMRPDEVDVAEAMASDSGVELDVLKVDGGVTANDLCMQLQADILGVPVSRPVVPETTALGAAYAAGLAVGFWKDTDELATNWNEDQRWTPTWSEDQRETGYAGWKKAVERTLDWVDVDAGESR